MAEYIDREAVYVEACRGCIRHGENIGECYSEEPCQKLIEVFALAPAADVAPVVRCKDCKHQQKVWHPDKRMKDGGYWLYRCERNSDPFANHTVDGYDDDFCSYGERKENKQ